MLIPSPRGHAGADGWALPNGNFGTQQYTQQRKALPVREGGLRTPLASALVPAPILPRRATTLEVGPGILGR